MNIRCLKLASLTSLESCTISTMPIGFVVWSTALAILCSYIFCVLLLHQLTWVDISTPLFFCYMVLGHIMHIMNIQDQIILCHLHLFVVVSILIMHDFFL
ncbi:hypothetical protein VPH35_007742 [Triticum aestivum]